ncbi:MAG: Flp family type IVb pilin [Deltaproteobacteria bacterium]|nr:Flp family type IVb pilin [Deltaproteobacteria bacterium]
MITAFLLLWENELGTGAVEYGLILALIVLVVLGGIGALGIAVLNTLFTPATRIFP